jgi:hypothetical protein
MIAMEIFFFDMKIVIRFQTKLNTNDFFWKERMAKVIFTQVVSRKKSYTDKNKYFNVKSILKMY